jgi:hypothetical protein
MGLKARRVDASVALKDNGQGVLYRVGFLGQTFHLDEHVLLAASSAGSARASNEYAATRKRMGITREREICLCHGRRTPSSAALRLDVIADPALDLVKRHCVSGVRRSAAAGRSDLERLPPALPKLKA